MAADRTAALVSGAVASRLLASAPGNLAAPASSAGRGSPASGCLLMGCAYRRAFPADFWLCSDPLRVDKPPALAVRMEGLLSV